jgi:hypothetical protein
MGWVDMTRFLANWTLRYSVSEGSRDTKKANRKPDLGSG